MTSIVANKPYSANVQLMLHAHGMDHELSKVGPDRIVLRNAVDLPPGDAILTINIDGQMTQHQIRLPDGASCDSPIVTTTR